VPEPNLAFQCSISRAAFVLRLLCPSRARITVKPSRFASMQVDLMH